MRAGCSRCDRVALDETGSARYLRGMEQIKAPLTLYLAAPRGFCAGVDRAIEIVKRAIETLGAPIYVRHEVVHNKFVVGDLKARGAVFVEELDEVPDGATVIFSAHGVSQAVREEAGQRGLKVFDATCPLVTKVHLEVGRMQRDGREIVMIGHRGHPEVEGTMGQGDGRMHLVESAADVERLRIADGTPLASSASTSASPVAINRPTIWRWSCAATAPEFPSPADSPAPVALRR